MLKILRNILVGLLVLVVLVAAGGLGYRALRKAEAAPDLVIETPNGIDEGLFVEGGGIEHWITIRGQDRDNPIILFVHGGPAEANSYFPQIYQPWERDFTVVQWDQRGTGRTYGRNPKPPADFNLDQMAEDGVEIAAWAAEHLGQDKVILVGHSWGSILGEHMVLERPDLFSAYVGTGQFEDWARQVEIQYAHSLARAEAAEDERTLAVLNDIGPPPYLDLGEYLEFRRATTQHVAPPDYDYVSTQVGLALFGPRVSIPDIWNAVQGVRASFNALGDQILTTNMAELGSDFPIPFFVIQGAEDHITPTELARTHFERMHAPTKELVLIDGAGHFAAMTHTEAFLAALKSTVLPAIEGAEPR